MAAYSAVRVRLDADLTDYHRHLIRGVEGVTVPGVRTTDWGWADRFAAVRYNCCGHIMDTLWKGLTVLDDVVAS